MMKKMLFLFFLLPSPSFSALLCQSGKIEDVVNKEQVESVVFFASWCQSCVDSIRQSDPERDLYVAVFDNKKDASKSLLYVLKERAKKARCVFDEKNQIAKFLGVDSLPKKKSHKRVREVYLEKKL